MQRMRRRKALPRSDYDDIRVLAMAKLMVHEKSTVRAVAKVYGISKSKVHTDLTVRLKVLDPGLYREVRSVLDSNKLLRTLRGGAATKAKYARIRDQKGTN